MICPFSQVYSRAHENHTQHSEIPAKTFRHPKTLEHYGPLGVLPPPIKEILNKHGVEAWQPPPRLLKTAESPRTRR